MPKRPSITHAGQPNFKPPSLAFLVLLPLGGTDDADGSSAYETPVAATCGGGAIGVDSTGLVRAAIE